MITEQVCEQMPEKPIRVLFISHECHREHYTERTEYALWYEGALAFYGGSRVHVGIAFGDSSGQADGQPAELSPPSDSSISYFPLNVNLGYGATGEEWESARCALLDVIRRFEPDVIQCFGSEWPHGAIAEDVDIPVIIHLMGFLNVYYSAIDMANGYSHEASVRRLGKRKLPFRKRNVDENRVAVERNAAFERRVMKANRFFMGRTEWDKNIVKYYSPGARYFHVPEMLRLPFIQEAGCWRYHLGDKVRLLTVSSADDRKGIEIILRTAQVLKELVCIDFEWRIAGNKEFFDRFERRCGIYRDDVNVRLLGMLEVGGVVDELKNADLFIHPSIIDNSPRAICEAQLIGCPVISSNVGGVPQLVDDGVTGFLYPYNEPHTLAFLIADLVGQRDTLTNVSRAASRVARERHDSNRIVDRIINVYGEVLSTYEK